MPDDQEPVLNKQAALELCDDDEDLFLEIVQAYLEDAIKHSKELLYALEAGDAHQVEERAHALKGASSNICAGPVREAALLLERAGRNGDLAQAPQLYKVFKKEFNRLLEHLKSLPPPSS
ncbi:MAG: Hpt domain-containing protein [Nitrospina sp.]|jgi:HPt (histidine-containing phosphotransfer) domain-containing protein|nr:Hpt domain-containing protein [Nitrospina sp.]MBT6716519.1 Hpt domain-containing protein [Nitrospina sp.]